MPCSKAFQPASLSLRSMMLLFLFVATGLAKAQVSNIPPEDKMVLCDYAGFVNKAGNEQEKLIREDLYLKLIGVLEILGGYRKAFLKEGDLINLFPTAYYHTTMSEMKDIVANDFSYPVEKMNQLLAFFDAYQKNRLLWKSNNIQAVQDHWQKHFYNASSGNANIINFLCSSIATVLESGIIAHVKYDLPRALRYAFQHRNDRSLTARDLIGDFNKTDRIFATTSQKTKSDVASVRNCAVWWQSTGQTLLGWVFTTDGDVVRMRKESWNKAFSGLPIDGIDGHEIGDQPFSDHRLLLAKGKELCKEEFFTLYLFDVSGSMNDNNKWVNAKQAATSSLDVLYDEAKKSSKMPSIGLMSYSGGCVDNPTTLILDFSSDKQSIQNAINNNLPRPAGSTPTPQAIKNAEALLTQQLQKNSQCEGELIILTDGQSTCGTIRPPGVFSQVDKKTVFASCQGGSGSFQMRYQTIGFDIQPGSEAERDLQYLSSAHGGRYFHASDAAQLKKAFEKISRIFEPVELLSTAGVSAADVTAFNRSVYLVRTKNYDSAFSLFRDFYMKYPGNSAGIYNYAQMSEATDQYRTAAKAYSDYLAQNAQVQNRKKIEEVISKMIDSYNEYFSYQKEIVKKDLSFLKEYFKRLMNGQSIPLANEFTGFMKEKSAEYAKLPGVLGVTGPEVADLCNDIVGSFKLAQRRLYNNPKDWDQDAVPLIAGLYLKLEKLSVLIEPMQPV